tara:strand:+ start:2070 stop:3092 length:1023 start_codon:yes stop_codon:yes gene_type:complete
VSFQNAFLGSLVADAVSMPVHWYYNVRALDHDYGEISGYQAPKNPHPDSILWRSEYKPVGSNADILHGQKKFWGRRNIHYHQHLQAGENTLNLQLAAELYRHIILAGDFKVEDWLQRYVQVMLTPGWHNDTYAEEYHRSFFSHYSAGKSLLSCGTSDHHIGALSMIPALLAGLEAVGQTENAYQMECVLSLVRTTHDHPASLRAATDLTRILIHLSNGSEIRESLSDLSLPGVSLKKLRKWEQLEDRTVVGDKISSACYLPDSFLASLYFVWKYHDDFSQAVISNAKVGGDNCHRGVVIGSIVASQTGIPSSLLRGLKTMEKLRCDVQLLSKPQLLKRSN